MADFTANTVGTAVGNPISRMFTKIWDGLVYLGETSVRGRALKELSEMSDEELAARGVTREEVVARVFADIQYL